MMDGAELSRGDPATADAMTAVDLARERRAAGHEPASVSNLRAS